METNRAPLTSASTIAQLKELHLWLNSEIYRWLCLDRYLSCAKTRPLIYARIQQIKDICIQLRAYLKAHEGSVPCEPSAQLLTSTRPTPLKPVARAHTHSSKQSFYSTHCL